MAVYYIDPYTTTNGSGTWASPFSFNSATRTGFAAGDELRIVAKYLTSLLTATSYTATRPNTNQLTITSGGGLGADFSSGDYVYFPDYDSFAAIQSVSTNTLSMYSAILPIPTTESITINVRKVDLTVATPSSTGVSMTLLGQAYSNTTVSDGWVADGVQVTDGTAKSIIRSTTGSVTSFRIDTSSAFPVYYGVTDFYVYAANTHYLNSAAAASSATILVCNPKVLEFGQFYANSGVCAITNSTSNIPYFDYTYTVKHLSSNSGFVGSMQGRGCTINLTNLYLSAQLTPAYALTDSIVNITTLVISTINNASLFNTTNVNAPNVTYNIGTVDIYPFSTLNGITGAYGAYAIDISGAIYYNRRLNTDTSVYKFYATGVGNINFTSIVNIPKVTVTGVTYTGNDSVNYANIFIISVIFMRSDNITSPQIFNVAAQGALDNLTWVPLPRNLLVTYADGTNPVEILGVPYGAVPSPTSDSYSYFPNVSLDAAVYRTTGPSLKAYLASYNATYWASPNSSFGTKTIKIPVVAGTTYTVSGYIRTDQTTFTNGNCYVSLNNTRVTLDSQSMTTACINAWEQFTLSYTATYTEEILLAVSMKFSAGAKAFWIDDITIA